MSPFVLDETVSRLREAASFPRTYCPSWGPAVLPGDLPSFPRTYYPSWGPAVLPEDLPSLLGTCRPS